MPVLDPDLLRAERERAGLSRETAAVLAGVSVSAMSKYEIAKSRPSAVVLGRLAAAYGCSVGAFYSELSAGDIGSIRRAVDAMPPLTEEQVRTIADVLANARAQALAGGAA